MVLRAVLAGASAAVSAVVGVVTNVYTDGGAWPWAVALATLVILGVGLQVAAVALRRSSAVEAAGAGSVAVGGSVGGPVRTRVRGVAADLSPPDAGRRVGAVSATGIGAAAVGGEVEGGVETSVDGHRECPQR
jgi:hypothetical protein